MVAIELAEHPRGFAISLVALALWFTRMIAFNADAPSDRPPPPSIAPRSVQFGDVELRYSHGSTRIDAEAIIRVLVETHYIVSDARDQHELLRRLDLRLEGDRHVLEFTYLGGRQSSDECIKIGLHFLGAFSTQPLPEPIDIALRDAAGVLVRIPWEHRKRSVVIPGGPIVEYSLGATESEARQVVRVIAQHPDVFRAATWRRVDLSRKGTAHVVGFGIHAPIDGYAAMVVALRRTGARIHALAGTLSHEVFGAEPVDVRVYSGWFVGHSVVPL